MTDSWLSKRFFDLQAPAAGAEYRAERATVLARYPLAPETLKAIADDDVGFLAQRVNPYLLRYYFGVAGMTDDVFRAKLKESGSEMVDG